MPFDYRCADHPDFRGKCLSDAVDHIERSDLHDGDTYMQMRDNGGLTVTFLPMHEALGNVTTIIYHCRRCGAARDTATNCEEC